MKRGSKKRLAGQRSFFATERALPFTERPEGFSVSTSAIYSSSRRHRVQSRTPSISRDNAPVERLSRACCKQDDRQSGITRTLEGRPSKSPRTRSQALQSGSSRGTRACLRTSRAIAHCSNQWHV